jgi:hypothetical protein
VDVVDGLAAVRAVVDDEAEALVELLLAGDLGGRDQEVAQNLLVAVLGLGQLREAVARLGDEDDVRGALRRDVAEREHGVVLEDHLGGDLLGDDLVEDGGLARLRVLLGVVRRGLARGLLLVRHGRRGGRRRRRQVRLQDRQATRQRRGGEGAQETPRPGKELEGQQTRASASARAEKPRSEREKRKKREEPSGRGVETVGGWWWENSCRIRLGNWDCSKSASWELGVRVTVKCGPLPAAHGDPSPSLPRRRGPSKKGRGGGEKRGRRERRRKKEKKR